MRRTRRPVVRWAGRSWRSERCRSLRCRSHSSCILTFEHDRGCCHPGDGRPAEPPVPQQHRQSGGQIPRVVPSDPTALPRVPHDGRRRLRLQHDVSPAAVAFEVLLRARGPDDVSVLPPPVLSGPAWTVDDGADLTTSTRNAADTMTVPRYPRRAPVHQGLSSDGVLGVGVADMDVADVDVHGRDVET